MAFFDHEKIGQMQLIFKKQNTASKNSFAYPDFSFDGFPANMAIFQIADAVFACRVFAEEDYVLFIFPADGARA